MSREQAKEFLKSLGIEEPSDEQIGAYLNSYHSETNAEKKRADDLQKQLDAMQKSKEKEASENLSELEKANQRIAELEKANVLSEVKAIFGAAGIAESDYSEYIEAFAVKDMASAKTMAQSLVKTITGIKDNAVKDAKKELLDQTKGGNPSEQDKGEVKDEEADKSIEFAKNLGKEVATTNSKGADGIAHYIPK